MAYPGQVVDLLMSTVETTLAEKITILDAIELKERIVKAIELLTRQIHVSFIGTPLPPFGHYCRENAV